MKCFGCHFAVVPLAILTVNTHFRVTEALASGFGKPSTKKIQGKADKGLQYCSDVSLSTKNLLEHLIEVEECEGLEGLDVGYDLKTNLRGLYAKETFQKGEYICAVPFTSTILLDETFYPTTEPTDEMKLSVSRLQNAAKFLEMVGKAETPLGSLYRASLPLSSTDANFSPTPEFWNENEIMELQAPSLVDYLLNRKKQVGVFVSDKQVDCTEIELMHAMWVVRSRAFSTLKKAFTLDMAEGLLQRTVMVPFFDLLNHKRSCNAKIEVLETKEYEASLYALVAERNIEKGEEITICYGTGKEPSWELFSEYGFWPEGHDENDQKQLSEVSEPDTWTTSLENDLDELNQLSGDNSIKRSILNFRVRLKKAERAR